MVYFTRKNFLSLLLFLTVSFSAFAQQAVVVLDQKKDACDGAANGSIRVTVTSGVAPLSYFYLGLGFGQTGSAAVTVGVPVTITGLQPDSYVFVMNDGDPSSNYNTVFTINNVTTPLAGTVDAAVNNASCTAPNGSISITASGGSGSYSYSWTGPNGYTAATDDITGLVGGTYTATIIDNGTNCTRTLSRTLTDPSPAIFAITTPSPAVVCPSAGWSLALGNSENGVTYTVYNNGGSTGITAVGNGSPLSFAIPGGSFVNGDVFTIRATNGFCAPQVMSGSVTVNIQNLVITVNTNTPNTRCVAPFNGAVNITLSGTTNPVTYAWTGPSGPFSTEDISAVQNGAYTVVATDNVTGCSVTSNINVADGRPTITLTNTSTPNTRCVAPYNGAINLTVSNALGAPTFAWTGPGGFTSTVEDPGTLQDGAYTVVVTDPTSGCTATANINVANGAPTITLNSAITANTKCVAPFNGAINLTVNNSIGTPTYAWTGPAGFTSTVEDPTALRDGSYSVTVTDPTSGCTATATIVVNNAAPVLTLTANVTNNTKCVAPSNGAIDLSVANGGPTYTYAWTGPSGFTATSQDLTALASGSYTVTVTDTNSGCTGTASYIVNDAPPTINIVPTITANTRCIAPFNGAISLVVTGGTGYTYSWTGPGGFTSIAQNITALQPGSYSVIVTETATGCTATLNNINVNDNPPTLSITGSITDNTRCVTPFNGAVDITVAGGTGPYTYSWVSSIAGFTANTQDISGLESGTYTVTVTETSTGCSTSESFAVGNVTPTLALSSTSTDNTRCVAPFNGAIDLVVAGGSGTYSYAWTGPAGFTATTQDITALRPGTYNVTVTDVPSGCTTTLSAPVVDNLPTLSITNTRTPNTRCVAPFNGSIDITIAGTAGPFTYAWTGPSGFTATTEDITALRDGTYNVTVRDTNTGCTTTTSIVVNPSTPTLTVSRVITNNTRCVAPFNGAITITPAGTAGPFTYSWTGPSGFTATTKDITALASGAYTVVITDTNSGCTTSANYTVGNTLPTINVASSITNNTHCAAPFNGAIDITITGTATGPFTYAWTGPSGFTASTQDITAVQSGSYTVTVTDTNSGCTTTRSFNVGNTLPTITIGQVVTANTACAAPFNGAINITVGGGSGTYTYAWTGPGGFTAITEDIAALAPGSYTVTVSDTGNGCTQNATINVPNAPITFTLATATTANTRCVAPFNGTVTLTVTGGVGPFTYAWTNGAFTAATKDLANVPAGTYNVVVTDQATNCQVTASATVSDNLPVITVTNVPTPNTRCVAPFNGAINITVAGGTAPYNYAWTGPNGFTATIEDITALEPGAYTVVVTDPTSGCSRTVVINVADNAPTLAVTGTITPNTRCVAPFNGAIDITATGGTAYTYAWTSTTGFTGTTQDLTALQPGDYTVVVTDGPTGCTGTATFTVPNNAPAITLSSAITHVTSCTTPNGAIDLSVVPAAGTYTYAWTGPGGFTASTQDITALAAGTYNITVTNTTTGCTATASYVVNNNAPTLNINGDAVTDNTRCVAPFNGAISITVTGGTGTLTYAWTGPGGFTSTAEDLTALAPGTYTVIVTDAGSGCTATAPFTINDDSSPLAIIVDNVTNNTRCQAPFNGAIAVSVTGSTGPFTYSWTSPGGFTATTEDISALAAGTYTLTVTDPATGCTATVSPVVNDMAPTLSITNITVIDNTACVAPFNGSIGIDITGGTGPYTYAWTGPSGFTATTEDITGLAPGTYTVVARETSTGCTGTASIVVGNAPASFTAASTSTDNTRCTAPYNGTIDLTVSGSAGPFTYAWTRTSGGFTATTEDLNGLQDGTYNVVITDVSTGCTVSHSQIVNLVPPVTFAINGTVTDNTRCLAPFDGAIALTITPASTYSFAWTGPGGFTSTSKDIAALAPGTYNVSVTDVPTGCVQTASFIVNDVAPAPVVTLDASTPNTACIAPFTGALSITATGGSGVFTYAWTGPGGFTSTNEDITALVDGDYDVTVRDTNLGCTTTATFTVIDNTPTITLPTQTVVDNTQCQAPFNGSITVAAGGTPGPFTYAWTGPNGYTGTGATITGLEPGAYVVTVSDASNGCSDAFTINVNDNAPALTLTVDAKTANTLCVAPFNGSISITVGGGTGTLTYAWTGPNGFTATTEDITALEDGDYVITVTDVNSGCTVNQTIHVDDNTPVITITATTITPNTSCTAPFNGAVTVNAAGTAGPYNYTWTGPNGFTGTGASLTGLEPGPYTVTATDQTLGCTGTLAIVIPNNAVGGTADAGPAATSICAGSTYTFTGATITNALTGTWSIVSQPVGGNGVLTPTTPMADPSTATFTATVQGAYVIRLTANTSGGACSTGTDDITINVDAAPAIPVSAGVDQTNVCGPAVLDGSSPAPGTGVWTVVAGPGDGVFIPNANGAHPKFTGTAGLTYTLRWTVTSGTCSVFDEVDITFDLNSPTPAVAGPDVRVCATTQALLGANDPQAPTEIGTWTIISTPADATFNPDDHTATAILNQGPSGAASYTLVWSIVNTASPAGCAVNADTVTVFFDTTPPTATAGGPYNFCGTGPLAGSAPGLDNGMWTIKTSPPGGGDGSFDDPTQPNATFSATIPGTYTITWTVSNACGSAFQDATVVIDAPPTVADAGTPQNICGTSTTLAGNQPTVGTGLWTMVGTPNDGVFGDPTVFNTTFSGTAGQTYTLRWTISKPGCTSSSDDVTISFNGAGALTVSAGTDQDICGTTTTLNADALTGTDTGKWTIISGNAATGVIATDTDPKSGFQGVTGQTYSLRWEVTRTAGGCTITAADTVDVTFDAAPTAPNAGPNQTNVCGPAQLAATAASVGTGTWTIVSGTPAGTFSDPNDPNATFTGTAGVTYVLQWTVTNGACTASAQVTISFDPNSPTPPNAGTDQAICGTTTTLAANAVTGTEQGTWTVVSGPDVPTFAPNINTANATFTGTAGSTYTLRWSIANTAAPAGCAINGDDVVIAFDTAGPTTAFAGNDQRICGTTVGLAANDPGSDNGLWTVSGATPGGTFVDATRFDTDFTGIPGTTYTLTWTVSNACGSVSDDVQIILDEDPATPFAGADQLNVCGPATLAADPATAGTGTWTIQAAVPAAATGTFSSINAPNAVFTGVAGASYTLRWTVSNNSCAVKFDEVTVSFNANSPTPANAGPDDRVCGTTPVTLAGNSVTAPEQGKWTIISTPADGTFDDDTKGNAVFTPGAASSYTLVWTITNTLAPASCGLNADTVRIDFDSTIPTGVDAGLSQNVCGNTATLNGSAPGGTNTGLWTVFGGTPAGGAFADATVRNTVFTGTPGLTYILQWTVSNACGSGQDTVKIKLEATPPAAVAGANQVVCTGTTTKLNATPVAAPARGRWIASGGLVADPTDPKSDFIGIAGQVYTLVWRVDNGAGSVCPANMATVTINFAAPPTVTTPVTACVGGAAPTLTATAAGATSFNWYYFTTPGNVRTLAGNTPTGSFIPTPAQLDMSAPGSFNFEVEAVYGVSCTSAATPITVVLSNTGSCQPGGGGCFAFVITFDETRTKRPSCSDQDDGLIVVTVSNVTPTVPPGASIEVKLIAQDGKSYTQHGVSGFTYSFPNLGASDYILKVKNIRGDSCVNTTYSLPLATIVNATASNMVDATCANASDGQATFTISGGNSPYEYSVDGTSWIPGLISGNLVNNLPPNGTYNILIRDDASDSCPAQVPVTINSPALLVPTISGVAGVTECNGTDGAFTVTIAGGSAPYTITLIQTVNGIDRVLGSPESLTGNTKTYNNLAAGTYKVFIQDASACSNNIDATLINIDSPGAIDFTVTKIGDASCTNNAKSGSIRIHFEASGNYLVGISTKQTVEPTKYQPVNYVITDPDIVVDTLANGNYFVFAKPAVGTVCPSVRTIINGPIGGAYAVSFTTQRVCNTNGVAALNITKIKGDSINTNAPVTIRIFRQGDSVTPVEAPITLPNLVNSNSIQLVYNPSASPAHDFLTQPDRYFIEISQVQQGGLCTITSNRILYSVTSSMTIVVDNIKASLPEPRQTGGFRIKDIIGGSPANLGDGPFYSVSIVDPTVDNVIIGPLDVARNAQGSFQHEFTNVATGTYNIVVTDGTGCQSDTLVIVPPDTRIIIPNVFTPNNDDVNDTFEVVNLPLVGKHKLVITNRWGNEVFTSSDYRVGNFWDAEGATEGIYYYRLKVDGGETYTGWVEIIIGTKP